MKVLLDECLPRKLEQEVRANLVRTVHEMGWASIENGALLRLAELEFDVFLTMDRNLQYQQNLSTFDLAVIVLVARSNDIEDLKPLMDSVNGAIKKIRPSEVLYIER